MLRCNNYCPTLVSMMLFIPFFQPPDQNPPARPTTQSVLLPQQQPDGRTKWSDRITALGSHATINIIYDDLRKNGPPPVHFARVVNLLAYEDSAKALVDAQYVRLDTEWSCAIVRRSQPGDQRLGDPVLEVFGARDLLDTFRDDDRPLVRIIHQAPILNAAFDPVLLIRAVNLLRNIGKDRALDVLESYARLGRSRVYPRYYELDDHRVMLILSLLFTSIDGSPLNGIYWGAPDISPTARTFDDLVFPMVLDDDIPFLLSASFSGRGPPPSAMTAIELCRTSGTLRATPLRPSSDPVSAAVRATNRWVEGGRIACTPERRNETEWQFKRRFWTQAAMASASIVDAAESEKWDVTLNRKDEAEAAWAAYVKTVQTLRPVWSEKEQDFVAPP